MHAPPASIVVFEEAHHHVADQWGHIALAYRDSVRIGLTATPQREDGVGLGNLFEALITVAQPQELIDAGFLVPVHVYAPRFKNGSLAYEPLEAWQKFGNGEQAIVFAASIVHAREIAKRFVDAGVSAIAITQGLNSMTRAASVSNFRRGTLRVLVGVHTLTEGFDAPSASIAILARNFSAHGSYLQAVGRVMRPAPGKTRAIVIDLMGASHEHGLPQDDRFYSLDGKAIEQAKNLKALRRCVRCGISFRANMFRDATCPGCGYTHPGRSDPEVDNRKIERVEKTIGLRYNPEIIAYVQGLIGKVKDLNCKDRRARVRWMYRMHFKHVLDNDLVKEAGGWQGL